MNLLIKVIFINISLFQLPIAQAEPIYEWTDTWGQIQYSTIAEPGSRLSELTEIPQTKKLSEQEMQQYQLNKFRDIQKQSQALASERTQKEHNKQRTLEQQRQCQKLRELLDYQRTQRLNSGYRRSYYGLSDPQSILLEQELQQSIRQNCR